MRVVDLRRLKPLAEMSPLGRALAAPVAAPAALVYAAAVRAWRSLPADPCPAGRPVISVGSVVVGGTGKTPLCVAIAQGLLDRGITACILSRGYRRKSGADPELVSDTRDVLSGVAAAGDEPFLMAKRLPGVPVVVGKNRLESAHEASQRLRPDLFILDDGLQYRRILKDLEIVIVDARSIAEERATLPLGRLREPWSSVRPEHVLVVRLAPGGDRPAEEDMAMLKARRVFYVEEAADWPARPDGVGEVLDSGVGVALVSGIAKPQAFEAACLRLGVMAEVSIRMGDHHWYTDKDAHRIDRLMREHGCAHLVTTEKDFYRMPGSLIEAAYVVRIHLRFERPDAFFGAILDELRSAR